MGRRFALIMLATLLLVAGMAVKTIGFAGSDRPLGAGLVVVLGDINRGDRLGEAVLLAGPQRELLVSIDVYCPAKERKFAAYAAAGCFRPDPFTTRGEAEAAARYATEHGLSGITVITTTDQVARARLRFARCWPGRLAIVAVPQSRSKIMSRLPYEVAATAKAHLWERGC